MCSHALPLSAEAGRVVRHMRPVLVVESENYNIYHQYCTWARRRTPQPLESEWVLVLDAGARTAHSSALVHRD